MLSARYSVDFFERLRIGWLGLAPVYGKAVIGVKDMERATEWYVDLFDFFAVTDGEGKIALTYPAGRSSITVISLVQIPVSPPNAPVDHHPILFTRNLNKTRNDLISQDVEPSPIQQDSGGNHFFTFLDFEGNRIEVCLEPGKKLR
jgi:Glyoxalase/Bleomycin resistance protein/Dioxygenase superfamily